MALSQRMSEVRKREKKLMEMVNARVSDEEIADHLGYADVSAVSKMRKRLLERHIAAGVEEYRAADLAIYDALIQTLYPRARGGDMAATDRLVKVLDQRAKLTGANAPTRIDAEITHVSEDELMQMLMATKEEMEAEKRLQSEG